MDTIDAMRTFVAVASELSFTRGAKRVGISTKVASRQIQLLEARLNAQLFNRTTRSVTLTDTGRAYHERCLPLLDQFDELEGLVQLRQSELAGHIRITAPTAFGSRELVQAIEPFQSAHPLVTVELQLSDQRVAIVEEGFDFAIRFGTLEDSNLVARRLTSSRVVVCASPGYLQREGEPKHPNDLQTHNCLLSQPTTGSTHWDFEIKGKPVSCQVDGTFRANSPRAVAHMALQGLGIGRCPLYLVEQYVQTKRIKLLFESMETDGFPLYAIYPQSRHLTARVRTLIDHLVVYFEQ
jgi:DNA-binding transcriptional LysR family regulator